MSDMDLFTWTPGAAAVPHGWRVVKEAQTEWRGVCWWEVTAESVAWRTGGAGCTLATARATCIEAIAIIEDGARRAASARVMA